MFSPTRSVTVAVLFAPYDPDMRVLTSNDSISKNCWPGDNASRTLAAFRNDGGGFTGVTDEIGPAKVPSG
jgi:hypothetical protein